MSFGVFVTCYLIYHSFEGRYSIINMMNMKNEVQKGNALLMDLQAQRISLQRRVNNIDKHIDIYLLEEEARKNGLVRHDELIIPLP